VFSYRRGYEDDAGLLPAMLIKNVAAGDQTNNYAFYILLTAAHHMGRHHGKLSK
jgi:hypothetical protein